MHVNKLTPLWKFSNSLGFVVGAGGFTIACALNFFSGSEAGLHELLSACFFIVGSLAFLFVAVQEYVKYCKGSSLLVANLFSSMLGAALYLIGAVGYLPDLKENRFLPIERYNPIGTWGFILGSLFISVAQMVKVGRILHKFSSDDAAQDLDDEVDNVTEVLYTKRNSSYLSLGLEISTGLGGWSFMIGSLLYYFLSWDIQGEELIKSMTTIYYFWILGACLYSVSAILLCVKYVYVTN